MKTIFHLDLDAFFASVEIAKNPNLKNKPIVVSGLSINSVVCTANYIARKKGIKAAMPIYEAKKICPHLILCPGDHDLYKKYSDNFFDLLKKKISNKIEITSIDECYLDCTNIINKNKITPIKLAKKIQNLVNKELNISVSIGISYTKFLAKMATDLNKPNGITFINQENIKNIIWHIEISHMYGIGTKKADKLVKNNILTIGQLANCNNIDLLKKILGKNYLFFINNANGIGDDVVDVSKNIPKSIGYSKTFSSPTNDEKEISIQMKKILKKLINKSNFYNLSFKTISFQYKNINRKLFSKSITMKKYTNSYETTFEIVDNIFFSLFKREEWKMISITFTNFIYKDETEYNIFNLNYKKNIIKEIINRINAKFEKDLLFIAEEKL